MVACDITTASLSPQAAMGLAHGPGVGPYRRVGKRSSAGDGLGLDPLGHWVWLRQAPPGQVAAWRRSHRVMSRLAHPNLAHLRDLVESPGSPPVLVESLRQESSVLKGRWPEAELARLGAQLAAGLAALHQAGWAHGAVSWRNLRVGPQGEAWLGGLHRLARFGQGGDPNRDLRALGKLLGDLAEKGQDGALMALRRRLAGPNPIGAAECAIAMGSLGLPLPPCLPPGRFRPPPGWTSWVALEAAPGWRMWTGPRGSGLSRLVVEAYQQLRRAGVMAIPLHPQSGAMPGSLVAQLAAWLVAWGKGPVPPLAMQALQPKLEDPRGARLAVLALLERLNGPVAILLDHWEEGDAWSLEVLAPQGGPLGHAHLLLVGEEGARGLLGWPLARWGQSSLVAWVEEVNGAPLLPGQAAAMAEGAQGLPAKLAKALLRQKAKPGTGMGSKRAWLALAASARRRAREGEPLQALAAAEGALAALLAIKAPRDTLRRAGTLAADLARRAGHGARAAKAYRTLLRQKDIGPGEAADLCISLARAELLEGRQLPARQALDQALLRLAPLGANRAKEARARVHLALARLLPTLDPWAASRHAEASRALSRHPAMRATAKAHAAHAMAYAIGHKALPALESAVQECMRTQDPDAGHTARMLLGDALMLTGRLVDARPCFASNLARARATGDPSEAAYASINLALVAESTHEPDILGHAAAGAEGGSELGDVLLEELGAELVATARRRRGPAVPALEASARRTPMASAYAAMARAEAHCAQAMAPAALTLAQEALPKCADQGTWEARCRLVVVEALAMLNREGEAQAFLQSWPCDEAPASVAIRAFAQALLPPVPATPKAWLEVQSLAEAAGLKGLNLRARMHECSAHLLAGNSPSELETELEAAYLLAEDLADPAFIAPLAAGLAAARPGPEAAKLADRAEECALQAWGLEAGPRAHPERRSLLEAGGQARVADLARRLAASEGRVATSNRVRQAMSAQLEASGHDLRGPLGAIRVGLQALRQGLFGPLNEDQDEAMADLAAAAMGLERRVDAMLDTARLEAGALAVQRLSLDWVKVVGEPVELLLPFAKQRGVRLLHPREGQLASLPQAYGDPRRLAAALQNLLHNALKFTPAGRCVGLEVGADKAWVHCQVWDEGPGLPLERQHKPFARYGHSTGGTGLGLWLAHEVVRLHGGQVVAQAREEGGTCFTIRLPQALRKAPSELR